MLSAGFIRSTEAHIFPASITLILHVQFTKSQTVGYQALASELKWFTWWPAAHNVSSINVSKLTLQLDAFEIIQSRNGGLSWLCQLSDGACCLIMARKHAAFLYASPTPDRHRNSPGQCGVLRHGHRSHKSRVRRRCSSLFLWIKAFSCLCCWGAWHVDLSRRSGRVLDSALLSWKGKLPANVMSLQHLPQASQSTAGELDS